MQEEEKDELDAFMGQVAVQLEQDKVSHHDTTDATMPVAAIAAIAAAAALMAFLWAAGCRLLLLLVLLHLQRLSFTSCCFTGRCHAQA